MLYTECWIRPEKCRKAKSAGSSCFGACRHLRMYSRSFLQRKKNFCESDDASLRCFRNVLCVAKDCDRQIRLSPAQRWRRQEWLRHSLGEEAANQCGFGDAIDGENHGPGARRNMMLAHGVNHFHESADHNLL